MTVCGEPDVLVYIPKVKWKAIEDAWKDEDGYWILLRDGWRSIGYITERIIHVKTVAELKKAVKLIIEK